MKKWYIRLDTQIQMDNELITMIKQDVYSNELYINLTNLTRPLSDSATIAIKIDKADGSEVIGSGRVISDKSIAYVVDYQAIAAIGLNTFTIKVVYSDLTLTTTSFIVNVIEDPFAGTDGSIESTSAYPILTALMIENTVIKDAELIRAASELDRIEKELNRVATEIVRDNKEIERLAAEESRTLEEIARDMNEEGRATQELGRAASEITRENNELGRVAQEDIRLINETNRGLNEVSRVNAEGIRVISEDDRLLSEVARVNNENARGIAEGTRVLAETGRAAELASKASQVELDEHKLAYVELEREVTELSYITQRYTIESWQKVQELVRAGLADKAFKVGDQFVANYNNVPTVFDVIGINHDVPTDKNFINSLTIQAHDCILNAMIDSPEALYMVKGTGLPAGVYHFTYSAIKYQFTLSQPVPIGGQLTFPWVYNTDILTTKISTFESQTSTVAIETVPIVIGSEGTELLNINDINRCRYGSNNYKESAVRQLLNNSAAAFVWAPQTDYDRPPTGAPYTGSGFLNLLDPELVAVIGEVDKQVARNTVTDGGGQDLFSDKVFLLSRVETGYGTEGVTTGEVVYPYYEGLSEAGKIKLLSNTPWRWWLRSPLVGYSHNTRIVYTSGALNHYYATIAFGLSPACVII